MYRTTPCRPHAHAESVPRAHEQLQSLPMPIQCLFNVYSINPSFNASSMPLSIAFSLLFIILYSGKPTSFPTHSAFVLLIVHPSTSSFLLCGSEDLRTRIVPAWVETGAAATGNWGNSDRRIYMYNFFPHFTYRSTACYRLVL